MTVWFPVSGVETWLWLPPLVAVVVSAFSATAGVSGAFLLLPFQFSVLGFTSPGVTPTNLIYNLVATPGGILRYYREGRMLWPLVWIVSLGAFPGLWLGYWVRVSWLPDPLRFRLVMGAVLLYLGTRLWWDGSGGSGSKGLAPVLRNAKLGSLAWKGAYVQFQWEGRGYGFSIFSMLGLSVVVGVVGGVYGIGGGAIVAPFCVAVFHLPVHAIAGATLAATLITSAGGIAVYYWGGLQTGISTQPDWSLGLLFGIGGLVGTYLGARLQRRLNPDQLRRVLSLLTLMVAGQYLLSPLL